MKIVSGINWQKMFVPDTPLLEIFIRGTLMYLAIFVLLRVVLKRESGTLGITDLLLVTLIADAASNGLADDYTTITSGVLLVATIVFWSHTLNWLGHRFPFVQRFIKPDKLPLVKNGKILHDNMKKELVTEEELMSEVRTNGINNIKEVKEAYMEPNGRISIICKSEK